MNTDSHTHAHCNSYYNRTIRETYQIVIIIISVITYYNVNE